MTVIAIYIDYTTPSACVLHECVLLFGAGRVAKKSIVPGPITIKLHY